MLQQTQTARVVKFYGKFLGKFPSFAALARAPLYTVLAAWQGLGYNRRAVCLKRAAQEVVARHRGRLPRDPGQLVKLPGVGANTAGAVCAYAFNKPVPFVETNVRKTFIRFFFAGSRWKVRDEEIITYIEKTIDRKNPREWYFAVVDYGAHLGKIVRGMNARSAHYARQGPFEGSNRQARAKLLKLFLAKKRLTLDELLRAGFLKKLLKKNLADFQKEKLILKKGETFALAK